MKNHPVFLQYWRKNSQHMERTILSSKTCYSLHCRPHVRTFSRLFLLQKKICTLSYFVVFFTQPLLLPFSFLYVSFQDMRLLSTGQPLCTKSFWEIQFCQAGRKHRPMLVRPPPLTTKWTLKLLGHGLPSLYDFPFVTWSRQRTHCKVSFCTELKKTFTLPNYREHRFSSFKT